MSHSNDLPPGQDEIAPRDADGRPIDPTLPTLVQRFLAKGGRLEEIRLDAHGHWWHEHALFNNARIEALFSRSVDRTEGGTWILRIGRFTYPIVVDDVGFFVEDLHFEGGGPEDPQEKIVLRLSDDTREELIVESVTWTEDLGFYCVIRGGAFEARFRRAPYYTLTERLCEHGEGFALRVGAEDIPIQPR